MERITSRQNEKVRLIASLAGRGAREDSGLFFFEGNHLFEEFVRFGHRPEYLFATADALSRYGALIEPYSDVTYEVTDGVYEKMSAEQAPQGILCVSRFLPDITDGDPVPGSIILESVRDNGNLGTVIRTAASLGITGTAISTDCADLYSPKTVRASMGAIFSTPIVRVADMPSALTRLREKGCRVFAALVDSGARKLGSFAIRPDDCFVVGNEGAGVSAGTARSCDGGVFIEMSGRTESLNVSAAATIILWEMKRSGNGGA